MQLQTLVFNTTTKEVKVWESFPDSSSLMTQYGNIPTVKVREEGFYEVIQRETKNDGMESNYPVARFPIQATNMIIEK
jgi:hypothetical protein